MFALVLMASLILLAIASLTVLADSGLRWWSAFGALSRQLAHDDRASRPAPALAHGRKIDRARPTGCTMAKARVPLRAAA